MYYSWHKGNFGLSESDAFGAFASNGHRIIPSAWVDAAVAISGAAFLCYLPALTIRLLYLLK